MELGILYSLLIFAVIATAALGAILGLMPSKDDVRETREAVRVINAQVKLLESAANELKSKLAELDAAMRHGFTAWDSKFQPVTTTEKCKHCDGEGVILVTEDAPFLSSVREALAKKR